jgi:hypothetical protein
MQTLNGEASGLVPEVLHVNVAVFYMFGRAFGKVTGLDGGRQSTVSEAI